MSMWVWKTSIIWKNYVWNPGTCSCQNEKYSASIMDDSRIMCDEITESFDKVVWQNKF